MTMRYSSRCTHSRFCSHSRLLCQLYASVRYCASSLSIVTQLASWLRTAICRDDSERHVQRTHCYVRAHTRAARTFTSTGEYHSRSIRMRRALAANSGNLSSADGTDNSDRARARYSADSSAARSSSNGLSNSCARAGRVSIARAPAPAQHVHRADPNRTRPPHRAAPSCRGSAKKTAAGAAT